MKIAQVKRVLNCPKVRKICAHQVACRSYLISSIVPLQTSRPSTVQTYARKQKKSGGKGFGSGTSNGSDVSDTREPLVSSSPPPPPPPTPDSLMTPLHETTPINLVQQPKQQTSPPPAPFSRNQIIGTCVQTSALIAIMGFGLHQLAPIVSIAAHDGTGHDTLLRTLLAWPSPSSLLPTPLHLGLAMATAGAITAARAALLAVSSDFKTATDASNAQVLLPLAPSALDTAIVSVLPAICEEFLFRGALIPAVYPDWRGVVVAGAVFGVLHVNGGRNATFGMWAALVGCVYGVLFLETQSIVVPMVAHSVANGASAALWLSSSSSSVVKK